jgi:hypothetical protein
MSWYFKWLDNSSKKTIHILPLNALSPLIIDYAIKLFRKPNMIQCFEQQFFDGNTL